MSRARAVALLELAFAFGLLLSGVLPGIDTYAVLALGWLSLRLRGSGWRAVGLARPPRLARHIGAGVLIGVLWALFDIFVVEPVVTALTGKPLDLSALAGIQGNARNFVLMLAIVWSLVAVGEEMTYRGYLLARCAEFFGGRRWSWTLALLLVSAVFGAAHGYQGVTGILTTGYVGLGLGILYLLAGRNLWLPMFTHASYDTVGISLIYLGLYPR